MKIAITGKGGSGKTTVAAGLAFLASQEGKSVIAVDCDPDISLGFALGFPHPEKITPISEMKELITERTESDLDRPGGYFKLNPRVDDIPAKFCPEHKNIRLIVMGKVNKAGGGCLCPENTFIKSLINHLVVNIKEIVILDMVAGTEHLGRGTANSVDAFLIVVEPTLLGINTGLNIKTLAGDLGIKKAFFVGNKINSQQDLSFLKDNLKENLIGLVSFNKNLVESRGRFVFDNQLKKEFQEIYEKLRHC
ncbi:MAG: AAA family ATPase [Candidatus Omnitrophota bacterium]|nr:AAA family ATPase [Candidatus Omnitrophota bacterium]